MPLSEQIKITIEEQMENERKSASILHESMKKTDNTVIRLLLHQLELDSMKHEKMLMAVLKLLKSPPNEQFKSESTEFRKIVEKHVEIEREMLEVFEGIVDEMEDDRIRFIIQDIISDEKRHHGIMKRLYSLLCEREKVRDVKWWDFLFRYSRLTG